MKQFIAQIAQALSLFEKAGLVHSDLKPENVLISINSQGAPTFKIIDLGSSFPFAKLNESLEVTTPEYLPPEILDLLD